MATIKDVAALAGISTTTVSIIINGKANEKRIPETTVERVLKAMQELNYRPDQYARRLRNSSIRKPIIGFFWPLDHRTNLLGVLLTAIEKSLMDNSFDAELRIESFTPGELNKHENSIRSGSYDGILIGATSKEDSFFLDSQIPATPIVMLNRKSSKHSSVRIDNRLLGMQAASLIRKKGYTECAVLKNESKYMATTERTQYFIESCDLLGIKIQSDWIFQGRGTPEGGAIAAEDYVRLGKNRPPVLFCEDDFMAQGAIVTIHDRGLSIPEDLELLAFGMQSNENMTYLIPSITTVSLPYMKMADKCVEILISSISGKQKNVQNITVEPEIKIRKSFSL